METGRLWDEAASGEGVRPLWSRTPSILSRSRTRTLLRMRQNEIECHEMEYRTRLQRRHSRPAFLGYIGYNALRHPATNGFHPFLLCHAIAEALRGLPAGMIVVKHTREMLTERPGSST